MESTNTVSISKRALAVILAAIMLFASSYSTLIASAASTKKITDCKFTVSSSVAYTGKALKPGVTVKDGKTTLKSGTHYNVTYTQNINFGTGKVTVKGIKKGGYTGSKTLTFKIVPAKPTSLKAKSAKTSITLSWGKVKGATQYTVYSYNSSNKKYTKLTTVKTNSATIKKGISAGKTYSYAVMATAVKYKKTYNSAKSAVFKCASAPEKVSGVKASSITYSSAKLTWKKVSGATGYKVYTYNASTKKYTAVATVTKNSATIKDLKPSTTHKLAVRAFRKISGTSYYGSYSALVNVKTKAVKLSKPTGVKASGTTYKSTVLNFKKVSGATGYQICSYNSSNKKYTGLATSKTNKATVTNLKSATSYKLAVRAYVTIAGKKYYGGYSSLVTVKTKAMTTKDYLTEHINTVNAGTFSSTFKAKEIGDENIIVNVKGNKMKMSTAKKVNGIEGKVDMYVDTDKNSGYFILNALGLNVYTKMTKEDLQDMNPNAMKIMLAPTAKKNAKVKESTKKLNGTTYKCASYETQAGGSAIFYFLNNQVKFIEIKSKNNKDNKTIEIISFSTKVDDSAVNLPKDFPSNPKYIPLDSLDA